MDDLFSHLANLTYSIAQQLIRFIEDLLIPRIASILSKDLVAIAYEQCASVAQHCLDLTAKHCVYEVICSRFSSNSPLQAVKFYVSSRSFTFILKGVKFHLYGLKCAWRLMYGSWSSSVCYAKCGRAQVQGYAKCARAQVQGFASRVSTTLRGSSGDIGWMQRDPTLPPVKDGSTLFLELLQEIRNGSHTLPDCFVYLLIPGLFSNIGPLYFMSTKKFFSKMGLACHIAKIRSAASVENNAREIKQYIEELYWGSGKRVMLVGHSKGGVDAAAALSMYQHELKGKVAGLVFVQSPYGGSPIASDILREGQIGDKETQGIMKFIVCKMFKGDMQALYDLTYEKRKEFVKKYTLPNDIPLISFHSETSVTPGIIASMSHIAHAELPRIPIPRIASMNTELFLNSGFKVPVVFPASAALAILALHLRLRYGEKSDGMVTCCDAEVPGSVVVKPDRKLDHAWMVYSCWRKDPLGLGASEMCETLLTMLVVIATKQNEVICP